MVNIKLKWNKEVYDQVELDENKSVDDLKQVIYDLTFVPKDRQKLMAKGAWSGILKDDADLKSFSIKNGQQVMLMGTAEVVVAPKESIQFVEDMSIEEQALKGAIIPAGLTNLGNTCYMNSTIQCLRYMPELRESISRVQNVNLANLLHSTFEQLDRSGKSVLPYQFVQHLRTNFPQFAQTNQHGYMQQDAEEFYSTLTTEIEDATIHQFKSLLGIDIEEQLTCDETDLEQPILRKEYVKKIVCNIQGGAGAIVHIDHMPDGIKLGLECPIEKFSAVLNREAKWTKKQRLASLPRYLCVQFMRFFWKTTPDSRDHEGLKCKILRSVSFQDTIDIYEICNAELQRKLKINRELADKHFEKELAIKRAKITIGEALITVNASPTEEEMDIVTDPDDTLALEQALKLSVKDISAAPVTINTTNTTIDSSMTADNNNNSNNSSGNIGVALEVGNSLPVGFTGLYELHGLVTHKGRSADSGHYIGWVRQAPGSAFWWCYNDDKVSEVKTDDILLLCGGGDRDMAYLTFYRYKETNK